MSLVRNSRHTICCTGMYHVFIHLLTFPTAFKVSIITFTIYEYIVCIHQEWHLSRTTDQKCQPVKTLPENLLSAPQSASFGPRGNHSYPLRPDLVKVCQTEIQPEIQNKYHKVMIQVAAVHLCLSRNLNQLWKRLKSVVRIWMNTGMSSWHLRMIPFVYTMALCPSVAGSSLSHSSANANFIDKPSECLALEISRKYHEIASEVIVFRITR